MRTLATNPLLLTILALMKRQGVSLPERRVELYDRYVEVLLSSWNRARSLDGPVPCDLDVAETTEILARLALWMHQVSPGVGLVEETEVRKRLLAICGSRSNAEQQVRSFLHDVREHSALLLERGPGQYGFIHLTFEEYLAAVGLAQMGQLSVDHVVRELEEHVPDPLWREVALLTVGYIGVVQKRPQAADALLRGLMEGKSGEAVVLAGDAVADVWPVGVTQECKDTVVEALLKTIADDSHIDSPVRVAAGNTLAQLGDPRFRPESWHLPNEPLLGFVEVPAGRFLMGSDKKKDPQSYEHESPQHELMLPVYYIGRYPVTVAQFKTFVHDANYKPIYPDCLRGVANHPVVCVTWHEALAYCDWLTTKLRDWPHTPEPLSPLLRKDGWNVTLPREAEWQKAARGTKGLLYPWGDEPDPNKANYDATGIDTTSAIGCFPGGRSVHGCEDMSGNVWEWTRSLWGKDWEKPDFGYPYDPNDGRESLEAGDDVLRVLRGGSFYDLAGRARCAYRFGLNPYYGGSLIGFRVVLSPF